MYKFWPGQAQYMTVLTFIWPQWPWPFNYLKNVSNGTSPPRGQQLRKSFWNPCINVQVMARTSSTYDHFDLYLTPATLTFNLPKNVSNGISPPRGQQMCKIILKSMHKCTSYGPDKLNVWPFWRLFDPCDLDLHPTWKKCFKCYFSSSRATTVQN